MKTFILKYLIPRFHELTLFLMGLSFFLLFFCDPDFHNEISNIFSYDQSTDSRGWFAMILWVLLVIVGTLLSAFHVFSDRKKSKTEKEILLYFGMLLSLVVGLNAGARMLASSPGFELIFPLWNLVCAFTPLWVFHLTESPEEYVTDDNATLMEVIIGVLILSSLMYYFIAVKEAHWSLTVSTAVFYAEVVDGILREILKKKGRRAKS